MTSQLVLTGSPYKGGSKYEPDTFSLVHPPHMETISPSESDSLADTDSDSTLNNESIGSSSKWSLHDCDSNLKLVKSGSSRDPLPLVDSQVFTFSTYSPAHWCTDDLDFWCAGEDRKLLRRCSLSYGARSLRNARTRSCSMPCRSSLIKESHPSIFGTGAPPEYTVSRAPRVASSGNAMNRRKIKGVVSNKWGNNPPAGYIWQDLGLSYGWSFRYQSVSIYYCWGFESPLSRTHHV